MAQDRREIPRAQARPAGSGPRRIQTFKSLGNPDFRLFWVGNIFNNVAMWLQLVSLGFLVWELTKDPVTGEGSAWQSGVIGGIRFLPTLFIGPWAGVLADRMDRRRLVMGTQMFLVACALLFAFAVLWRGVDVESGKHIEVWHAYLYAAVSAVGHGFLQPARQALTANTVPREDMGNAFALNSMTVTSARLIGGLSAGVLIGAVGFTYNFFVEAVLLGMMVVLLVPMRARYGEESSARRSSVFGNLRDGIAYIWRDNRVILHLILMNFVLVFAFRPIQNLLPAYTSEVLGKGATVGGYLMAAQGVGGITGALVLATLAYTIRKGQLSLISLMLGSVAMIAFGLSQWLWLSLVMMSVMGFCQTSFITSNMTLVQQMAPDDLRGRISSIYMLESGLGPLAIFIVSIFIELFGARGALAGVAAVSLALAIYFQIGFQQVRELK